MAERLKNIFFTRASLNKFAEIIRTHYPEFNKNIFLELVFDHQWDSLELKQKMRHTTKALHRTLPSNFEDAIKILIKISPETDGFEGMVLPDFVEMYGLDNWEISLPALKYFTESASSEFAIRPFLAKEPEKVMALMTQWADDKNENVRRFASEGCRPRLPWAMALPRFKKDPGLIFPILEKLKNDDSEFVRKSVANNLNDISKDHPEQVLDICESWYGKSEKTDWIIKQACRTLLKSGNRRALSLFGFGNSSNIIIDQLKLDAGVIHLGGELLFWFLLIITDEHPRDVRLEYAIDFLKANNKHSRKIFKITEKTFNAGQHLFSKSHLIADMTTRKHYPGEHTIAIIANGIEMAKTTFEVKNHN